MNHYSHRGQILPLKNQMVPISKDTTFHASFDKNLDGFGKDGRIKPVGPTHAIYMSSDNKIMGTFGAGINPQNTDFHISLWVRPDDTSTNQAVLGFSKDGDLSKRLYLSIVSGHWAINVRENGLRVDESRVKNGWTFIEFEGSRGTAKLRMDGNLIFVANYNTIELGDFNLGEKSGLNVSTYAGFISDIRVRFNDELTAYYPCDEAGDYVLYDASGNGNDAVSEQSVGSAGGPVSVSIISDGKFGNAVDISSSSTLEYPINVLNHEEGTIAFWAKVPFELPYEGDGKNLHMSTSAGAYGGANSLNMQMSSGYPNRIVGVHWASESGELNHTSINYPGVRDYRNGDWNHFVITWNINQGWYLYLNGYFETSSRTNLPLRSFDSNTLRFTGIQIDELRIENRMISNIEIKAWFESSGYHNHLGSEGLSSAHAELEGLEMRGRNYALSSSNLENQWSTHRGSSIDYERVDMSEEWGFSEAYRITTSGGDNTIKAPWSSNQNTSISMEFGSQYTASFWIKNNSNNEIWINTNGLQGQSNITIPPKFSGRISGTGTRRVNFDWFQLNLSTSVENNIDVIIGRVQVEKGTMLTDWTLAPEDREVQVTRLS